MKKLVAISIMAAMLLSIGVVAMADQATWTLLMKLSTGAGTTASTIAQFGTKAGAGDGYATGDGDTSSLSTSNPNVGSYQPTWPAPIPIYSTDKKAPIAGEGKSWTILAWLPGSWSAASDAKLIWYGTTSADIVPQIGGQNVIYTLKVDSDPSGKYTGQTFVIDANKNATSTDPFGSLTWTAAEAASLKVAANGDAPNMAVKMTLTAAVPEPSSMLALASGLFGMAGFAIRRRK